MSTVQKISKTYLLMLENELRSRLDVSSPAWPEVINSAYAQTIAHDPRLGDQEFLIPEILRRVKLGQLDEHLHAVRF